MKIRLLLLLQCVVLGLSAQISGGGSTFDFMNLPSSARMSALGGSALVMDRDVANAYLNPSLLNEKMNSQLVASHNFHFSDISNGYIGYGHQLKKWGLNAHIGVNYINYGDFVRADEVGNDQGSFSGGGFALTAGVGKKLNERLHYGLNLKLISARLESYHALGIAADLAMTYKNDSKKFLASFLIRNLGAQLSTYADENHGVPLDVQIGFSKRLEHLPFRFYVTMHHLHQWDIRYDDPAQKETVDIFGQEIAENDFANQIDNLFRHFVFAGEFLLGKRENLGIRFGYNHLRRAELSVSQFRSMAGFSLGFGLKIRRFKIDYGIGYHHVAGATNHISLSTNLREFKKKV